MKSAFLIILVAISLGYLLPSCSTDLDLTADWEEITVVYGMLNRRDSANYVRVSKAFLDKETSALVLAQRGDSLFHQQTLIVQLEEYFQDNLINTHTLTKVDGTTEGIIKEPGIFATSPNTLYKTTAKINQGKDYNYKLIVSGTADGDVTAETPVVGGISNVLPNKIIPLNWAVKGDFSINWRGSEGMALYDLVLTFHYSEYADPAGTYLGSYSLDWPIVTGKKADNDFTMVHKVTSKNLYSYVASKLAVDNAVFRVADSFDIRYFAGEQQLATYIEVVNAQLGLTQTQIKPSWTNVNNGYGLFSSRYDTTIGGIPFTDAALDSFGCGKITGHLNFAPSPKQATWPDCP